MLKKSQADLMASLMSASLNLNRWRRELHFFRKSSIEGLPKKLNAGLLKMEFAIMSFLNVLHLMANSGCFSAVQFVN